MFRIQRLLVLGACSITLMSGCGVTSYNSTSGADSVPVTTGGTGTSGGTGGTSGTGGFSGGSTATQDHNHIVATPAIAGVISVEVGMPQTISVTFMSSDGKAITGFGLTDTLSKLPVGWTGPPSFGCATVSTGSGCVLNLTYAPTAYDAGETLTLDYVYVDNALEPHTAGMDTSTTLMYRATTNDNAVGTISPTGQIVTVIGTSPASQTVTITFNTDDQEPASNLNVTTDLTNLPPGWTSSVPSFSCPAVSTGNGCQLTLNYAPTVYGMGILVINYTFNDDSGTAKVGANNIPYVATTHDNVGYSNSPTGQIAVIAGTGSQTVNVVFTTDDGAPASGLDLTTDLTALPAGWSSAVSSFRCPTVDGGNGCVLTLTYAPTAYSSGTLMLNYTYNDDSGTAKAGSDNIPYVATVHDNVSGTPSPIGTVNAIAGAGSTPVTITFATNDGFPASALNVTTDLTMLPAGWSSAATTFGCSSVSAGTSCQLPLMYAPTVAGSGTLTIAYSYMDDAGSLKTGNVSIPYKSSSNNVVNAGFSPSALAVSAGSNTTVTLTFATDDGAPASGLSITSGLTTLPSGWTAASSSFTCPSVSHGTVCSLSLDYAPTAAANATLSFGYSYTSGSGVAKSNTAQLMYSATP